VSSDGRLYSRPLPGGGYVAIESQPEAPDTPAVHALLLVERRADPARRLGHSPPVVAEAVAPDPEHALDALFAIAINNVEIARALQRWAKTKGDPEG
jgi:hypothetical protein